MRDPRLDDAERLLYAWLMSDSDGDAAPPYERTYDFLNLPERTEEFKKQWLADQSSGANHE